jgi:hypothetical protein
MKLAKSPPRALSDSSRARMLGLRAILGLALTAGMLVLLFDNFRSTTTSFLVVFCLTMLGSLNSYLSLHISSILL